MPLYYSQGSVDGGLDEGDREELRVNHKKLFNLETRKPNIICSPKVRCLQLSSKHFSKNGKSQEEYQSVSIQSC